MVKQLNSHISYESSYKIKKLNPLTYRDFLIFRKKFCGSFIFRGKKTFSIKFFHYIVWNLKKYIRRKKWKITPMKLFFLLIKQITPFLTLGYKKYERNVIAVPSLLFGNKKNVFLIKWIVKQAKNKSNIFGIKKEDVLKNILDILKKRGVALKLKEEHNNKIILTRINLKNEGVSFSKGAIYQWEKENYIESKYTYWRKEIERLNEELQYEDEEIDYELQRWKDFEKIYRYTNSVKNIRRRMIAKDDRFLYKYKKLFVK
jgi:ribosomal protein S7